MKDFIKKNYLIIAILILAFLLRIIWLDRVDIQSDEGVYSFISVGYYDFLNSSQQTTPVQWFGYIPWWSKLSTHGAPPLVFLIQYLFFFIFGISTIVARLPFVVFGILTVYLLYLVGKKLFSSKKLGLVAAFILAIFNYHIWISRTGFLESILLFFIILNFYYFLKLAEDNSRRNYLIFGLTLGLAFFSKYTMVFLLPAYFFYLLIFNRKVIFNKKVWLSLIIFIIVISPVIFYNIMVYKTRGHLDLQFSLALGLDISKDWPMFAQKPDQSLAHYLTNLRVEKEVLQQTLGLPMFILFALSIILILKRIFTKKDKISFLIFILLFFLFLQFVIIGPAIRFLPLFTPFIALSLVFLIKELYLVFKSNSSLTIFFTSCLILLSCFYIVEDINTHLTISKRFPYNQNLRQENYGFRQLDKYLGQQNYSISTTLFLYDTRLNWFSRFWYFYRRSTYFKVNFTTPADFLKEINDYGEKVWADKGYTNYYFIKGVNTLNDPGMTSEVNNYFADLLRNKFNVQPTLIYRDDGQIAFEVYNYQ